MNYKTGGGHKKEEENEGRGSSAGPPEEERIGEEQENTMTGDGITCWQTDHKPFCNYQIIDN